MPELSVLWSPDKLCWAHVIFPTCTQAISILQSLTSPHSLPLCCPITSKFSRPCLLLMTCPRKLSCRWRIVCIVHCTVHLLLSVGLLPDYFSSPSMVSVASSATTKLQLPSTYPSSFLRQSKFHIRTRTVLVKSSTMIILWQHKTFSQLCLVVLEGEEVIRVDDTDVRPSWARVKVSTVLGWHVFVDEVDAQRL